ncbi:MAG: glycosyltransferase family 2 protein [Thermodesulfobacteriota bacterium]|nr:glycosyltransferase family 2 protein [Thermodesulfobacteriota bacterium]
MERITTFGTCNLKDLINKDSRGNIQALMEDPKHLYPLVSVVIPTRERPGLVGRAVKSALRQTLDEIEVIVVIDGPDEETFEVLHHIQDMRLLIIRSPIQIGAGEARNVGVKEARGKWIAFLDDDDEWLPQKLEIQLQAAKQSSYLHPIISCRFIARAEEGDLIWPRRYPKAKEPLSEYLFCQSGLFGGEGFIAIPSTLTTKELLKQVPFKKGLIAHHDWEWLLRVSTVEGVGLEFVPLMDPLVVCNMEKNRNRISSMTDWRYSLSWGETNRHLLTPRAYISFLMVQVSLHAVRMREWRAFWSIFLKACQHGRPSLIDFLAYLLIWFIPQHIRSRIVILYDKVLPPRWSRNVGR